MVRYLSAFLNLELLLLLYNRFINVFNRLGSLYLLSWLILELLLVNFERRSSNIFFTVRGYIEFYSFPENCFFLFISPLFQNWNSFFRKLLWYVFSMMSVMIDWIRCIWYSFIRTLVVSVKASQFIEFLNVWWFFLNFSFWLE